MATPTGLKGNFDLTALIIDANVRHSPGVYALGTAASATELQIDYVGRSDDDVNQSLKTWVGSYRHFQFIDSLTPLVAFEMECRLWHTFRPRGNNVHPARPAKTWYNCPVTGCASFY